MAEEAGTIHVSWESRLSAIETAHMQSQKELSQLAADQSALTQAVKSLRDTVERLATAQMSNSRTNWSAVWAALGVVAVIAALVVIEPMYSLEGKVGGHVEDGHPEAVKLELSRVEQIIHANERALEARLDRKQSQLLSIENRLDDIAIEHAGSNERLLDLEREVYSNARYRAGRPIIADEN